MSVEPQSRYVTVRQLNSAAAHRLYKEKVSHDENKLAKLIKWSLRRENSDSSEITVKAREALERIKKTGPLNAIRVARYSICLERMVE